MSIDAKTIEEATGLQGKGATARWWMNKFTPPGRKGAARKLAIGDAAAILVARQMVDEYDFSVDLAVKIARALGPDGVSRLAKDENANIFVSARRNTKTGNTECSITSDPIKALETSTQWDREAGSATILLGMRGAIGHALQQLVAARRNSLGMEEYGGPTDLRPLAEELARLTRDLEA